MNTIKKIITIIIPKITFILEDEKVVYLHDISIFLIRSFTIPKKSLDI